jgi:hypothetical protein
MQNKLITVSLILIFILTAQVKGQKLINSPYSRFNIGTLDPSGSVRSLSMGGTGVAMRDNSAIYFVNPASYTSFDTTSFLFDFGMDYSINILNDGENTHRSDDNNFDHLLIGFPMGRGWGMALGIVPVSNGYYNLSETTNEPGIGEVYSIHSGKGGLANVFIGTGKKITRSISLGINMNVLFGTLERTNQFEFKDYANTFSQFSYDNLKINGINFDYGLQYNKNLKKDYFFTAGISMSVGKRYRSELEQITVRYAAFPSSLYSPDTLSYVKNVSRDSTRLGSTLRLGVAFGMKDKFVVGIDYVAANWADARIHGSNGYLADTKSLLFGIEYIPEKFSNTSYLKRIEYRIGGHIADNYLLLNGVQIKEYGASCGIGLRIRNSLSKANLYFEYTRKNGDLTRGLHNENLYTIGLSLNLYDFWFIKRQYE